MPQTECTVSTLGNAEYSMAVSPKWNAILQFLQHFTAHISQAHKSQMTECHGN